MRGLSCSLKKTGSSCLHHLLHVGCFVSWETPHLLHKLFGPQSFFLLLPYFSSETALHLLFLTVMFHGSSRVPLDYLSPKVTGAHVWSQAFMFYLISNTILYSFPRVKESSSIHEINLWFVTWLISADDGMDYSVLVCLCASKGQYKCFKNTRVVDFIQSRSRVGKRDQILKLPTCHL